MVVPSPYVQEALGHLLEPGLLLGVLFLKSREALLDLNDPALQLSFLPFERQESQFLVLGGAGRK